MLFLFNRGSGEQKPEDARPNDSLSMSQASSRELKKAQSTPLLRINGIASMVDRAPATHPLLVASPNLVPGALDVSSAAADSSPTYLPDQAYNKHNSFTRKIRYRLSSFSRASGSPLVNQQESFPTRTDPSRTSNSKAPRPCLLNSSRNVCPEVEHSSSFQDEPKAVSSWNTRYRSKSVVEPKPPAYNSSRTFFKDGLSRAHRFLGRALEGFSEKDDEEDVSEDCHDQEDEDLNRLYSNEMVPLEFPDEQDEQSACSPLSSFGQEVDRDRRNSKNCEDVSPRYCFKKQSSSSLRNTNQLLSPQNQRHPSSLHSSHSSQLTCSSIDPNSVSRQQPDVKLRFI
ncbi:hypothetical protein PCANC_05754 [Puccinia coronata f. sp. avenae]|uniref:Uncharacterized protein n=1 Tax=Puccinia coronata f. sp. avenae TaxID=200324 RepID=A0A2N5VB36_9BASI|nr:hypothetical protein PCANC_24945 [Puccinia coronata f. sp. avenae]PLW47227.1 hypothetical protein PCASD_02295 [Puccinia coronata f. sp. avenae]PLW52941.1 hypothetical protein PCANC_05754 [Puccinia coronata f. sp. avenae]